MCLAQGPQHSDAGEARTCGRSVSKMTFGKEIKCKACLTWSIPFDTLKAFLKEIFEKVNFEKCQQTTLKAWQKSLQAKERVKPFWSRSGSKLCDTLMVYVSWSNLKLILKKNLQSKYEKLLFDWIFLLFLNFRLSVGAIQMILRSPLWLRDSLRQAMIRFPYPSALTRRGQYLMMKLLHLWETARRTLRPWTCMD